LYDETPVNNNGNGKKWENVKLKLKIETDNLTETENYPQLKSHWLTVCHFFEESLCNSVC